VNNETVAVGTYHDHHSILMKAIDAYTSATNDVCFAMTHNLSE
jgi:hypothetical protein